MSDQNNALIVGIAQIIDYPSVYMGGPSRNSLRIAETIVKEFGADLARADRAAPPPACQQEAVTEADLAAARAEIERLTKERDAQYDENVHRIAMQAKAEADRDVAKKLLRSCLNGNNTLRGTVQDLKGQYTSPPRWLQSMLADAERDMRQRAAEVCDRNDQVSGWVSRDAILALPLKHADQEEGK